VTHTKNSALHEIHILTLSHAIECGRNNSSPSASSSVLQRKNYVLDELGNIVFHFFSFIEYSFTHWW